MKKRLVRTSVRLPVRFEGAVGLGDVVSRVTKAVGLPPCAGCRRRAGALDRALTFTGRARPKPAVR